jgi:polar amino acid transport system substrate-binding protein
MPTETLTDTTSNKRTISFVSIVALFLAAAALWLSWPVPRQVTNSSFISALVKINKSGTIRVGYEGYPPYTIKNPSNGELSGFSVDLAAHIAREARWHIEWVQTSPDTKITDLQADRFDVMAEPIFRTIPRATQVSFSRPYAYFGDAAAIVKKGDTRFSAIGDLNKKEITIAVRQGYTDQTYAADNLPNAMLRALKVDDASQIFLEVLSGKADIALADLEQARAFAAAHSNEVDLLFADPAPSYIPAGMMLRQGDFAFYNFLNAALDYMEANGDLDRLNRKYNISTPPPAAKR